MLLYEERTGSGTAADKDRSDGENAVLDINTRPYMYDYRVIALSSTRLMFIPKKGRDADRFDPEINSLPKEKRPDGPRRHHIRKVSGRYTNPT